MGDTTPNEPEPSTGEDPNESRPDDDHDALNPDDTPDTLDPETSNPDEPTNTPSGPPTDTWADDEQPPWLGPGGWKRTLAGITSLLLILAAISTVTWWLFQTDSDESTGDSDTVLHEECRVTESDDASSVPPFQPGEPEERTLATISTSYGDIDIMLFGDIAPCGVDAFTHLAETGFYTGHDCDWLTTQTEEPTAVLECGQPEGDPDGPGWRYLAEVGMTGETILDALAIKTDDSGRAGSAFTLIRGQSVATAGASVIGQIIDGFDVLDQIAALPEAIEYSAEPPEPVTVYNVTMETLESDFDPTDEVLPTEDELGETNPTETDPFEDDRGDDDNSMPGASGPDDTELPTTSLPPRGDR